MFLLNKAEGNSFGEENCAQATDDEDGLYRLFLENEDGQGITEYGAIIAFVSLLVALTFSAANGSLMPAVSAAFKAVNSQLNALSTAASSAS